MKIRLLGLLTFILFFAFEYTAHAESIRDYYKDITENDLKNSMIRFYHLKAPWRLLMGRGYQP